MIVQSRLHEQADSEWHVLTLYNVFTRFVPHPRIVLHCGTIRKVLSLFLEIMLIAPHPQIVPHDIFCKHLLLVLPYLKYSYPSQCKYEIGLVSLDSHETIEIPDII